MTKLEKIDKELEKSREKTAEWQAKIKDLERLHGILSLSRLQGSDPLKILIMQFAWKAA